MGDLTHALREGLARVGATWRHVLAAWAASLLLALPLAAVLRQQLSASLGNSLAATRLTQGWDDLWFHGFEARAQGLAATFQPAVVGVGAVLRGLDAMVTGALWHQHAALVSVGLAYALLWTFLSAGFVGTYVAGGNHGHNHGANNTANNADSFMARAARLFPRFAAVAAVSAVGYGVVFALLAPQLGALEKIVTDQVIDERIHFAWVAGKYLVVWLAVWVISLVSDYARIRSALDPDAGFVGTWVHAARLVSRHAPRIFGLSLCLLLLAGGLLGLYALVAPGSGDASWAAVLAGFALSQAYLVTRIVMRCLGLAAHSSLAQRLKP